MVAGLAAMLCLSLGSLLPAQEPAYDAPESEVQQSPPEQAPPLLSPGQLADLVAPIALYPDPLLSQILVVSTYPQELYEAAQWIEQYGNVPPAQLVQAARQQNWDPSIQVLVGFPQVMAMLAGNMQWTSALGQAFSAQPVDVMNAIQDLRARARANGQLAASPEYSVNTQYGNGESAIEIQPANPQTMYVPEYNPYAVWGSPPEGDYPDLPYQGNAFGSLFESAINIAGLFAGFGGLGGAPGLLGAAGLLNPTGWGWALGWLAHTLFLDNGFFSHFGFHNYGGSGAGLTAWAPRGGWGHDGNWGRNGSQRFGGAYAGNRGGWNGFAGGSRGFLGTPSRAGFGSGVERSNGGRGFEGGNWNRNRGNWAANRGDGAANHNQWATRNNWAPGRNDWAANHSNFGAERNGWRLGDNARFPSYNRDNGRSASSPWNGNRSVQSSHRFAPNAYGSSGYRSGSANFRAPSSNWRSGSRGYSGFQGSFNNRAQSASRGFEQPGGRSILHPLRSSEARMNASRNFGSGRGSAFRAPKAPRMPKAPHFSAPKFKSHGGGGHGGGGRSSHGHGGGGGHHRR